MQAATLRSEEAYLRLRKGIARQEIPPGTWLRQRTIAAKLGMSPTPLVQALRRLEHEGLLECLPQWGVRVRALTVPELDEVFRMRLAMESIVFRELAAKVSVVADSLNKLRPMAERVDQDIAALSQDLRLGRREMGDSHAEDYEFHLTLARLSGMKMVPREIDRLCLLSATIVVLVPNPLDTVPTHVELLEAILTGNSDVAEQAIRANIEADRQYVLPFLHAQFGDDRPIIFRTDDNQQEKS